MNKSAYRDLFIYLKKYIKFNQILKELNINQPDFSHWLKGKNDYGISVEKLNAILDKIYEISQKVA